MASEWKFFFKRASIIVGGKLVESDMVERGKRREKKIRELRDADG
jgi:hypothetical protein